MKPINDASEFRVEKSDDLEITPFQQRNNAESFQVLSSDIYKHPVLAIIRELCANAVDAHVVGKNLKTPYVVHTPTALEPWWSIRDYGTGIAPDKIKTVYTVYFESDKRDNNDTIGEKGLGSKTPFAYTDNFTVTNYYQGKKYCYTAFKNDDGLPCIAIGKDGVADTDEHDGLEIRFAVKNEDQHQFRNYLPQALKFFKFKPEQTGAKISVDYVPNYLIKTPEFGILTSRDTSYLIMGNIGYPVEVSAFENTKDVLDNREKKLFNYGIHLFVPIGSPVRTIASREALNYTPNTRAFIKKIIKKAVEVVEAEANKELANAKTVWEARSYFGKIRNGVIGAICDLENTHFVNWHGKKISDVVSLSDFDPIHHPHRMEMIEVKEAGEGRRRRRRYYEDDDTDGAEVINSGNGIRRWEISSFAADATKLVFHNDMERGGYAAAARYLQEKQIKRAIMLSDAPAKFVKDVGFGHLIVCTSSIPKPDRKKREYYRYGSRERTLIQRINGLTLENCEVELSRGGIYVEVRRDKVKWHSRYGVSDFQFFTLDERQYFSGSRTIADYIEHLKVFGYGVDDPIYAIRPCDKARIARYEDQWTPLHKCFGEALENWAMFLPTVRLALTASNVDSSLTQLAGINLAANSVAKETIKLIESCQAAYADPMVRSFNFLNEYVKMYEIKPVEQIEKQQKLFYETYPLLKHVNIDRNSKAEVESYIQMIDQSLVKRKVVA